MVNNLVGPETMGATLSGGCGKRARVGGASLGNYVGGCSVKIEIVLLFNERMIGNRRWAARFAGDPLLPDVA